MEKSTELFRWSFSKISKMLESPVEYKKKYILGEKEDGAKYFEEGELIHYLLLKGSNIGDKYVVLSSKAPSDKLKAVIQFLIDNDLDINNDESLLMALKVKDLYQTYKVETQLANARKEGKEYFDNMKASVGKIVVDIDTMARCMTKVEIIKANKKVMDLIGSCDNGQMPVNEIDLFGEVCGEPVHGIIDNLVTHNGVVIINDFKTTSKSIQQFRESYDKYFYDIQAALYMELVKQNVKIEGNTEDVRFRFNFIVFDKYNNLYVFPVSEETLAKAKQHLEDALKECVWHFENDDYTLPVSYALGQVIL